MRYEISKGQYIEITDEELEAIALESTKTINVHEFVPPMRLITSTTSALTTSRRMALCHYPPGHRRDENGNNGRVALTSREHIIATEPRGKGSWEPCYAFRMKFATTRITTFQTRSPAKML
jgi:DNA end-binding protein Ku